MVYHWLKNKLRFQGPCLLCRTWRSDPSGLCPACHADLPRLEHPCSGCALPLSQDTPAASLCGACQEQPPLFDAIHIPLRYRSPVDYLVKGLKFSGRLALARPMAQQMLRPLQPRTDPRPDRLIPVPLHLSRQRERGFNQSLELTRWLSRDLGLPMDPNCCRRRRATEPQSLLPGPRRRSNVRGAFQVIGPVRNLHLALVDDVVTSGSTVTELSRILKAAGAHRVEVWAFARAGGG